MAKAVDELDQIIPSSGFRNPAAECPLPHKVENGVASVLMPPLSSRKPQHAEPPKNDRDHRHKQVKSSQPGWSDSDSHEGQITGASTTCQSVKSMTGGVGEVGVAIVELCGVVKCDVRHRPLKKRQVVLLYTAKKKEDLSPQSVVRRLKGEIVKSTPRPGWSISRQTLS